MIRSMMFVCASMCAILLASISHAGVDLSLNLDFNTPGDMSSGGTWTAVAKTDENGLAGIVFLVEGSNNDAALAADVAAAFDIFGSQQVGLVVEVVEGSSLVTPVFDVGVIGGTFPSTYVDPVSIAALVGKPELGSFTGGARLATGTFDPGVIPDLVASVPKGNSTLDQGANVYDATGSAVFATLNTTVRAVIPEPATVALFGIGLIGLMTTTRRQS